VGFRKFTFENMKEQKEKIDYRRIIESSKPEMEKAIKTFEEGIRSLRSSRGSFEIVENLQVECFGQKFLMKQLGQISIPQARQILISPWDPSYIEPIVKALEKLNLGASPVVEGNSIKINLPPVTEEFKKDLLKILSQKKELAKKQIREARRKAWDKIQQAFLEGKISEDQKYKGKDELQDLVDEFNEKLEEISQKKEKEILG
jgi:ribosome recycling factor